MRDLPCYLPDPTDEIFDIRSDNGPLCRMIVLISGVTKQARLNFSIKELSKILNKLQNEKKEQDDYSAWHKKEFPHWYDKEGNYISDYARHAMAR